MFKVNSKALAAAITCQAIKDVRYYLNGVLIEPAESGGVRCVGTNGHHMIVVTDKNGECEKPVIIAFDSATVTKLRNKKATDVAGSYLEDGTAIARINGLGHVAAIEVIDGKFPDYTALFPQSLPEISSAFAPFNAEYMRSFCDAAKYLGNRAISFVNSATKDEKIFILFGASTNDGLHARGLLMPVRYELCSMPWLPE